MSRVRRALAGRGDGLAQIAVVLGAVGAYEVARILIKPDWPAAFANAKRVGPARADLRDRVGGLAAAPRPGAARPRARAQHLLLHRALPVDGDLLLLALPPLPRRLPQLPRWLPGRDGDRDRHPLEVPDRAAAPRRRRAAGHAAAVLGIDIGSPHTSALTNPVAAVPSLHAAYALGVGVGVGLARYARSSFWRLAGALYPPLVFVTIVVTGNHFILDAVAGTAVLGAGFLFAGRLGERRRGEEAAQEPCYT